MTPETEKAISMLRGLRKEYALINPTGKRISIDGVDCIIHMPTHTRTDAPAFLLLHGGTWIGGDAVIIDSLAETVSAGADCVSININYTKLDEKPFPYPMEEILRVIEHLKNNSVEYGIDPDKIVICGCSAGAHLAAGTAVLAKQRNISLAKQILVYPFTDWSGKIKTVIDEYTVCGSPMTEWKKIFFSEIPCTEICMSPAGAPDSEMKGLAPAYIVVCGKDDLREHGTFYHDRLLSAGVRSEIIEYKNALHGFLETNRPDFWGENPSISEEQAGYARDCEQHIIEQIKKL